MPGLDETRDRVSRGDPSLWCLPHLALEGESPWASPSSHSIWDQDPSGCVLVCVHM